MAEAVIGIVGNECRDRNAGNQSWPAEATSDLLASRVSDLAKKVRAPTIWSAAGSDRADVLTAYGDLGEIHLPDGFYHRGFAADRRTGSRQRQSGG
jgi:hypothetical protein